MEILQSQIKLEGKQFNAWHYLTDNTTTEIFYGGAAGGGKSYLGCVWHIYRRTTYPGTRGLIGRSDLKSLEGSTLETFWKVCHSMGYEMGRDFQYNSQKHIISWANGSKTILKDLFQYPSDPDFISLGSTEFTDVFIDEGPEIAYRAFEIVKSRIRWMLSDYDLIPKILVTCNPSPGWVKDNYLIDPITNAPIKLLPHQKFVRALVTDNPDKDFVDIYKGLLEQMKSDYDRERLLFGNWAIGRDVTNPFAHQYDSQFHESEIARHHPEKQLYISIDFNLNPFAVTFWHHWQDLQGFHWWGIDEAEIAQGSIPAMIELIHQRYGQHLHTAIITGDSMGNQRQIALRDNSSHYQSLQRGLNLSPHQIQVPANPTHVNSRDDVNKVLFEAKRPGGNFSFLLNPYTMPNTVRDFKNVQCDAMGGIMKGNRKDLNQRGDFIDCSRYLLHLTAKPIILRLRK